jgi:signal transduction histidine kinase/ligand-binding sensor domain-containing protein
MKISIRYQLIAVLSVLFTLCTSFLQAGDRDVEIGYPFIRNFSADDYKANTQNFAVVQDHRGVMYMGNFSGILEYDGAGWRVITTRNITKVSSLACDSAGRVWVGARGEIGYLAPGPQGRMQFMPLDDRLDEAERDFLDVIATFATPQGIYFVTDKSILLYQHQSFTAWDAGGTIQDAFFILDELYYCVKDQGLMRLHDGRPQTVAQCSDLPQATEVTAMLAAGEDSVILGTPNQGLFLMTRGGVAKWATAADPLFRSSHITCGLKLSDGSYVFGTARRGLIAIEADGQLKQVVDKTAGLRNDEVSSLYIDHDNALWAALANGLALVETPSPLSSFNERNGLEGGVTAMIRHDHRLFVATYQGLYYYSTGERAFRAVTGITTACWSVIPFDRFILVATTQGVYEINDLQATPIAGGFSLRLFRSLTAPSVVFVGQTDGLRRLQYTNNRWIDRGYCNDIHDEIQEIAGDRQGNLWLNTPINGLYLCREDDGAFVQRFDTTSGLPSMVGNHLNELSAGIILTTRRGLCRYNPVSKAFETSPLLLNDSLDRSIWLSRIVEDRNGNLWTAGGDEKGIACYLPEKNDGLRKMTVPFLPVGDFIVWTLFPEANGTTWFGGPDGLIRYDPSVQANYDASFYTLIRRVVIKNDSVIFYGSFSGADGIAVTSQPSGMTPVLDYANNSIQLEYASTAYHVKGMILYQYFLEGFDKIPSEWRVENTKEYTNLPHGSYMFHVRSQNIYDNVSGEATFAFNISTPWFMTWWAYVIYILLAGGVIYIIVRLRSQQLMKEKLALENTIRERTSEVVRQKEEIEQKSLQLSEKNDELEKINNVVKSINSEIDFARLLQSVLNKMTMIRGVEKAIAFVYDKSSGTYRLKASYGPKYGSTDGIAFNLDEAEEVYLRNSMEVYEDIFVKKDMKNLMANVQAARMEVPRSMIVLVIRVENSIEGFLLLQNMSKENAFDARDFEFIKNSKEHIISAFIKTKILEDLQTTLNNLKDTQDQLVQSEKLASLGQLTAGIAHEIQNPLNFVNNFSKLSIDLTEELKGILAQNGKYLPANILDDVTGVIEMLDSNVRKINEHGMRADRIVKGMLQHSRGKTGEFLATDINLLVDEYINLAYHGTRAENKDFNATFVKKFDPQVGKVKVVPQDFSRVILNIINNACYAVFEKSIRHIPGYSPEITITTERADRTIIIRIKDNGTGIPQAVIDKVFNPFFTTKPTGKGTGLGLSVSFDIITSIHTGRLEVVSTEGESTEFIITIPDKA